MGNNYEVETVSLAIRQLTNSLEVDGRVIAGEAIAVLGMISDSLRRIADQGQCQRCEATTSSYCRDCVVFSRLGKVIAPEPSKAVEP